MKFDKKEIKHIAGLARLELTENELKKYGKELSNILNWIDQLKEVDTIDVDSTSQVTGIENIFREDVIKNWDDNERKFAVKQSLKIKDGMYKVKRILK